MWHATLIGLHAGAGVFAFACGLLAIARPRWFAPYQAALVACIAAAAFAVAADWGDLDGASRIIFVGLVGLGAYMIWRSMRARRLLRARSGPERERFLADLGFTLVALFVAFAVIAVLDLGAPGWAAAAVGAAGARLGHYGLGMVKRRQTAAGATAIASPSARHHDARRSARTSPGSARTSMPRRGTGEDCTIDVVV